MLSDDLLRACRAARKMIRSGAMTQEICLLLIDHLEEIGDGLKEWELTAIPGPAARLTRLPDNVVRFASRAGVDRKPGVPGK